jgi:guanyl-specific ribonuclease Sa
MEKNKMIRNMKLRLLLSAAIVAGGFTAVYSAPDLASQNTSDKAALESLVQFPGAPAISDIQIPEVRANYQGNNSGNSNTCTPSAALIPGSGFSPDIQDPVRNQAIIDLLGKIAKCQPLPYSHDGITNTNTEGGMPQAPMGFYKEYTLMVPGRQTGDPAVPIVVGGQTYMTGNMQSARGPERIIIGGGKEIYYTMDHYKTFLHLTIVK